MAEKTVLEFEARLTSVKPVVAKGESYNRSNGRLEVTMAIAQPEPPRPPHVPYMWSTNNDTWKGRPADLTGKAATDEAKVAARKQEQERYDEDRAKYEREFAKYERERDQFQQRTIAYAQLVGLAAVFGDTTLTVRMTPKQDVLPGFGVSLLAEPAAPVEALPAGGEG